MKMHPQPNGAMRGVARDEPLGPESRASIAWGWGYAMQWLGYPRGWRDAGWYESILVVEADNAGWHN